MVVINVFSYEDLQPLMPLGIPYVHLLAEYYDQVVQYTSTPEATATVGAVTLVKNVTAPAMASFSSKGPAAAGAGVVMKPDITAPGGVQGCDDKGSILLPAVVAAVATASAGPAFRF
jgi:hypothetical protein